MQAGDQNQGYTICAFMQRGMSSRKQSYQIPFYAVAKLATAPLDKNISVLLRKVFHDCLVSKAFNVID